MLDSSTYKKGCKGMFIAGGRGLLPPSWFFFLYILQNSHSPHTHTHLSSLSSTCRIYMDARIVLDSLDIFFFPPYLQTVIVCVIYIGIASNFSKREEFYLQRLVSANYIFYHYYNIKFLPFHRYTWKEKKTN